MAFVPRRRIHHQTEQKVRIQWGETVIPLWSRTDRSQEVLFQGHLYHKPAPGTGLLPLEERQYAPHNSPLEAKGTIPWATNPILDRLPYWVRGQLKFAGDKKRVLKVKARKILANELVYHIISGEGIAWIAALKTDGSPMTRDEIAQVTGIGREWVGTAQPGKYERRALRDLLANQAGTGPRARILVDGPESDRIADGTATVSVEYLDAVGIRAAPGMLGSFTYVDEDGLTKAHVDVILGGESGIDIRTPPGNVKDVVWLDHVHIQFVPNKLRTTVRSDGQSLVNMAEFFTQPYRGEPYIIHLLKSDLEKRRKALEEGKPHAYVLGVEEEEMEGDPDQWRDWALARFLERGGDIRHFPAMYRRAARAVMARYLAAMKELETDEQGRLRSAGKKLKLSVELPAVGAYARTDTYLREYGVEDVHVPPGHVLWTPEGRCVFSGLEAEEALETMGGGDFDDGIEMHVFEDIDGELKVLLFRRPNQRGEWVLKLSANSREEWLEHVDEIPVLDSRYLPPMLERDEPEETEPEPREEPPVPGLGPRKRKRDRVKSKESLVYGMIKEAGLLGQTVFLDEVLVSDEQTRAILEAKAAGLTWHEALLVMGVNCGLDPEAARQEKIIDASVKTGDDLSEEREAVERIIKRRGPQRVERVLRQRGGKMFEDEEGYVETYRGWYSAVVEAMASEVSNTMEAMLESAKEAEPPVEILEGWAKYHAMGHQAAGTYNAIIADWLRTHKEGETIPDHVFEEAEAALEAYMGAIKDLYPDAAFCALAGMAHYSYTRIPHHHDGAVWVFAEAFQGVLVAAGLLNDEKIAGEISLPDGESVTLKNPWLVHAAETAGDGRVSARDFTRAERKAAQQKVAEWVRERVARRVTVIDGQVYDGERRVARGPVADGEYVITPAAARDHITATLIPV